MLTFTNPTVYIENRTAHVVFQSGQVTLVHAGLPFHLAESFEILVDVDSFYVYNTNHNFLLRHKDMPLQGNIGKFLMYQQVAMTVRHLISAEKVVLSEGYQQSLNQLVADLEKENLNRLIDQSLASKDQAMFEQLGKLIK